ncbi:MAG: zinc ABC transporter substrate-binding protein [Anaerolineae bacterium]|nr:zinc ABC transporter substrate-binding protein [Anaerolineae bacterium]
MIRVVATTTQAADLATILTQGVEDIQITGLMGAGVDPHLYKPTEADIAAMSAADAVIYSGLHLEGQFDTVFEALGQRGVIIFPVSKPVKDAGFVIGGFTLSAELTNVDDPHFWFDPRNWEMSALDLAETLAQLDPAHAETFRANAQAYTAQLQALFAWGEAGMSSVPEAQRHLVTSHDAFQYFGGAFGWQMTSIQGISTADEAGVGDVQAVIDTVIEGGIPVLFVESSVSPATINAVQEGVRAAGGSVRLGVRSLYSDAMDIPGTFGGTYTGMIASNIYTILQSFQCAGVAVTIPEWDSAVQPEPPADLLAPDCQ